MKNYTVATRICISDRLERSEIHLADLIESLTPREVSREGVLAAAESCPWVGSELPAREWLEMVVADAAYDLAYELAVAEYDRLGEEAREREEAILAEVEDVLTSHPEVLEFDCDHAATGSVYFRVALTTDDDGEPAYADVALRVSDHAGKISRGNYVSQRDGSRVFWLYTGVDAVDCDWTADDIEGAVAEFIRRAKN